MSKLLQQCQDVLRQKNEGAPLTQKTHLYVMHNIMHELQSLRCLPRDWQALTNDTVHKLVEHWKQQGQKSTTIQNKLSVLRKFLAKLRIPNAIASNNQFLQVAKKQKICNGPSSFDLNQIDSTIIKTIVEFEIYFGLTKFESMRWSLFDGIDLERSMMIVHRTIAYSKKRREMPIFNEAQQTAIANRKNFLNGATMLSQYFSVPHMVALYNATIKLLNLNCSFRDIYINGRFLGLNQTENETKCYQILMAETGLKTKYALKQRLWQAPSKN